MTPAGVVDRIRALPRAERLALYRNLSPGTLASQRYAHAFWARPSQALPAVGDLARVELVLGGFGAGKTWWAVMLFLREYLAGRVHNGALVSAVAADVGTTLIRGESGLFSWLPYEWRQKVRNDPDRAFVRTRDGGTFQLPGLPPVTCLSVESPGRAVGHGKDLTLWDDPAKCVEVCGERKTRNMFTALRKSTREGPHPSIIIPTTTNGVAFLRRAMSGNLAGVRKRNLGSARDNSSLAKSYADDLAQLALEGEDLGGIDGLEREDTPGALWRRRWIDAHRVETLPELARVVVAIDPADDAKKESDETGIVVVGIGHDGRLYVIADYTGRHRVEHWAAIAVWAFGHYQADAIVYEANRCPDAKRRCIQIEGPNVPLVPVVATRGKDTRAEPLSLHYRDGRVSHLIDGAQLSRPGMVWIKVPVFDPETGKRELIELEVQRDPGRWTNLEDELCGWVPRQSRSPNGLDALVWGCWHLVPPDGGAPWQPTEVGPALEGRYAQVDPRRQTRFQSRRAR